MITPESGDAQLEKVDIPVVDTDAPAIPPSIEKEIEGKCYGFYK